MAIAAAERLPEQIALRPAVPGPVAADRLASTSPKREQDRHAR
jgi:hypothetical protein